MHSWCPTGGCSGPRRGRSSCTLPWRELQNTSCRTWVPSMRRDLRERKNSLTCGGAVGNNLQAFTGAHWQNKGYHVGQLCAINNFVFVQFETSPMKFYLGCFYIYHGCHATKLIIYYYSQGILELYFQGNSCSKPKCLLVMSGKTNVKKKKRQKNWQQTHKNNNIIVIMTLQNNGVKIQRKNAIHTCTVEQNFEEHLWLLS